MADQETNHYKAALARAESAVASARDGMTSGGSLSAGLSSLVPAGGWVCTEADTWSTEVSERCSTVPTAFDDAIAEVHHAWRAEPDEVDEGNWRGSAYLSGQHVRRPGMTVQ